MSGIERERGSIAKLNHSRGVNRIRHQRDKKKRGIEKARKEIPQNICDDGNKISLRVTAKKKKEKNAWNMIQP